MKSDDFVSVRLKSVQFIYFAAREQKKSLYNVQSMNCGGNDRAADFG